MADLQPPIGPQNGAASPPPQPKRNPALRMLGMPNVRWKLPSRNWLIFLSITGSFSSMILYDRYQKKKIQRKWCAVVSHIAQEPLDPSAMPRRVTVFLAAPPGDGLKASRDHFIEYVKPVLVAGALDWDVVEGRQEGEVRAGLAERIRRQRRQAGETSPTGSVAEVGAVEEEIRRQSGVREWPGTKGDLIIGRHTWKEYVRGLHEGWLGPLDLPPTDLPPDHAVPRQASSDAPQDVLSQSFGESPQGPDPQQSSGSEHTPREEPSPPPPEPTKPSKQPIPPPSIFPVAYSSSSLAPTIPDALGPSTLLPQPHVLGFLNTPIRIYRFLNRRHLADRIGRETAALVLAASTQPYQSPSPPPATTSEPASRTSPQSEIHTLLAQEELDWHKSVRQDSNSDSDASSSSSSERVWLDPLVLDDRIIARMRRFELSPADERRAENENSAKR